MKKVWYVIRNIFLGIGVALMAVFYTLLSVVQTPFKSAEYRKTAFARDTGADYEAGILDTPVYQLYNRLRAEKVPVSVITDPKHPRDAHLLWKDTLIIHEIDRVALREGLWVIGSGSPVWKEGLALKTAVAEILDNVFNIQPGLEVSNAIVLLDRGQIPQEDRLEAETMPMFLLYRNEEDRFEILKAFCR